jgi:flavodoxin
VKRFKVLPFAKITLAVICTFFISCSFAYAQEDTTGKTLILYYSKTGNTRAACESLQKALDADLTEIKDLNNRHSRWGGITGMLITLLGWHTDIEPEYIDMNPYSRIIVASPIWAARFTPAIRTFVETNRFDGKKVAIFVTADTYSEKKYREKCAKLVMDADGDVVGFFQVQAKEEKNGEEIDRTKEQMVEDTLKLVPEIKKTFAMGK